jgi:hypothetical protein
MSHIPSDGKPSLMEMMKAAAEAHQSMRSTKPDTAVPDAVPMTKQRPALPMTNNNRAPAPPLVLLKRVNAPPQEAPMSKFETMLKGALANLESGNLDTAERLMGEAERMSKHSFHFYGNGNSDDDEDDTDNGTVVEDTWSEPADSASPENNADLDDSDGEDDDNGNRRKVAKWAHDQTIRKWSDDFSLPHMGGTASPLQPSSLGAEGPSQRADTYQLSVTPTVGTPARTSFDDHVDRIAERDKCSRLIAQQKARVEQPASYQAFQQFTSEEPTSTQAMRRDRGMTTKAAPTTWEDRIAHEMASKGVTEEIAKVRVLQAGGGAVLRHTMIQKRGPSITRTFAKAAAEIMEMDGVDRCESLRRLRKERPDWYRALNAS